MGVVGKVQNEEEGKKEGGVEKKSERSTPAGASARTWDLPGAW